MEFQKFKKADLDRIKYILEQMDNTLNLIKGYSFKRFEKNNSLKTDVRLLLHKIGKSGVKIKKRPYAGVFMWNLFTFIEWGQFDEDDEFLWDLLKGYTYKGTRHESLADYRNMLGNIYEGKPPIATKKGLKVEQLDDKKVEYITDYKYPTKTSKSLWTVKKK